MSARSPFPALLLLGAALACRASAPEPAAETWRVQVVVDTGAGPARHVDVRVAAGATALEATRAAVPVEQGWVCCSDEDVWAVDGLPSDPARDGWWSWLLDGEMGPGFAHLVALHDGATVTWRYGSMDPEGEGADPVARVAALDPSACTALESFGAGHNLVAHGVRCGIASHARLPRVGLDTPREVWADLHPEVVVDGPSVDGARALEFAPGHAAEAWEALGQACGRRGAARAVWAARQRGG